MAISDKKHEMNKDQFEEACAQYGADMSTWPAYLMLAGQRYVSSEQGARDHLDQQALDATLKALAKKLSPIDPESTFMARLSRIPVEHAQEEKGIVPWLKAVILPAFNGFGPRVFVQQVAVFMVVVGLGVVAGVSGLGSVSVEQEQVDISDGWLALTLDVDASGDVLEE